VIQRIQTLYLALAAVCFVLVLVGGPVFHGAASGMYGWYMPAVVLLCGLAALGSIGAIFLYTDRRRQRSAVVGLQFLALLAMIVFYGGLFLAGELGIGTDEQAVLDVVALLSLPFGYVFLFMARRGIDKDIALVRSMDRLR
jgi:hypothetical protein